MKRIPKDELNGLAFAIGARISDELEKMSLELEGIGVDTVMHDIIGLGPKFYLLHGVIKHPLDGRMKEFHVKLNRHLKEIDLEQTAQKLLKQVRVEFYGDKSM